jgi:hypothetical protein
MSGAFGGGSSSSQSTTTPLNLQNPSFTNLASGVAGGLSNFWNSGPNGFSTSGGTFSPFTVNGQPSNNPNANPLVAPLTPAQMAGLTNIGNASQPGSFGGVTPGSTAASLSPFMGNYAAPAANNMPAASSLLQSFLDPNFASNLANSAQTKSAISAATGPLEQAFRSTTIPGITGASTQAGQRTNGPGQAGSSAFDQAFANQQGNLMATEGQVAGGIANQAYQTGLQINANAPSQAAGLASAAEGQQIQAQQAPVNIGTSELNNMIQSLQAEVLPQLTQQYGINQGMSLFNTQIQTLLQSLGLGAQAAQPAIGYNGQSNSKSTQSPNIFGTLLGGIGSVATGLGPLGAGLIGGGGP